MSHSAGIYMVCFNYMDSIKIGCISIQSTNINIIEKIFNMHSVEGPVKKICFFPAYISYHQTKRMETQLHNQAAQLKKPGLNNIYKMEHYELLYDEICRVLETMADVVEYNK